MIGLSGAISHMLVSKCSYSERDRLRDISVYGGHMVGVGQKDDFLGL